MLARRQTNIKTTLALHLVFAGMSCGNTAVHTQVFILYILILLYVAFCIIMAISRQKEERSRNYALLLFRMTSRVLYSAQYHRQHCTLHAFKQFGALYMHNHADKYPSRLGLEPGTPRLQAPVDTMSHRGRPGFHTALKTYKDKRQYLLTSQNEHILPFDFAKQHRQK